MSDDGLLCALVVVYIMHLVSIILNDTIDTSVYIM